MEGSAVHEIARSCFSARSTTSGVVSASRIDRKALLHCPEKQIRQRKWVAVRPARHASMCQAPRSPCHRRLDQMSTRDAMPLFSTAQANEPFTEGSSAQRETLISFMEENLFVNDQNSHGSESPCSLTSFHQLRPHFPTIQQFCLTVLATVSALAASSSLCVPRAHAKINQAGINGPAKPSGKPAEAKVNSKLAPAGPSASPPGDVFEVDGDVTLEEAESALAEVMAKRAAQPAKISVPLRIVALQGTVPTLWKKEFLRTQGPRVRLAVETRESFDDIASELQQAVPPVSSPNLPKKSKPKRSHKIPAIAADVASVSDRWLKHAVQNKLIVPIPGAEGAQWYKDLTHPALKRLVRRNSDGDVDDKGAVYGAPYRLGCLMVAWRSEKFADAGIPPIKQWKDLWRPELKGKVAMIKATRETLAIMQKSLGGPINVTSLADSKVPGGKEAVRQAWLSFIPQVCAIDNTDYLKAVQSGDAWVAVGWSSDILPFVKRNSRIEFCTPEDGTILFADLWTIPATERLEASSKASKVGGRVRGPSPLVHQWFTFCLEPARDLALRVESFAAFAPGAWAKAPENEGLEGPSKGSSESTNKEQPKVGSAAATSFSIDEVSANSEFLEPMSNDLKAEYEWIIGSTPAKGPKVGSLSDVTSSVKQWWQARLARQAL